MLLVSLCLGTLELVERSMTQLGAFAATNCFPSGFPSSTNTCARHAYFEAIHDVFEKLASLTSPLARGFACPHVFMCVQEFP